MAFGGANTMNLGPIATQSGFLLPVLALALCKVVNKRTILLGISCANCTMKTVSCPYYNNHEVYWGANFAHTLTSSRQREPPLSSWRSAITGATQ